MRQFLNVDALVSGLLWTLAAAIRTGPYLDTRHLGAVDEPLEKPQGNKSQNRDQPGRREAAGRLCADQRKKKPLWA